MPTPTPPPVPNADFTVIRANLYTDIVAAVKTITAGDPAKQVFQFFDIWNQQLEYIEKDPPFKRPALFIEFTPIAWQPLSRGLRQADAVIRLHIVTDTKKRTADGSAYQADALSYLGYPDDVLKVMRAFGKNYAGTPENTLSETDHNHSDIIDMIEEYTMRVEDATAVRIPATVINVQPVINPPPEEPEV